MSTFSKIAQGLRLTGVAGTTNDIVSNWLKGLGGSGATPDMLFALVFSAIEERVLIDLSPTSGGFYSLSSSFNPSGNYTLEIDIQSTNGLGSENGVLFGSASNSSTFIGVLGNGNVFIRSSNDSQVIAIPASFLNSQKIIKFKLVHISGTVTVSLSGTIIGSISQSTFPVISSMGSYSGGANFFNGILSNAKLSDDGTPANSLEFALNQLTANTETNNGVTATYNNIGTANTIRNTYTLSTGGTQLISDLRTIDIAAQA